MIDRYAVRASKLGLAAVILLVPACSGSGSGGNTDPQGPAFEEVLTWHNDTAHTGQYLSETILTPASVAPATFGKLFTCPVDGQLFAQTLLKSAVSIPGKGVHNVVYAVTMHDSVYAFDADSNTGANASPLWQMSFINPPSVTSVPLTDYPGYTDILNEIGILSTPVIEPVTGTLYVVVKTKETAAVTATNTKGHVYRLHALDLSTGSEKFGGPVVLAGSVPGTGDANVGGIISFDPILNNQRSALCLGGRTIYIAFSSYGDNGPYHGWVLAYDAFTLGQVGIWNDTPNNPSTTAGQGGIWMNSSSPAFDGTYVYLTTGNGFFDATGPVTDYGDSVVKLLEGGSGLAVQDYFTPSNQASLSASDYDLDAGGLMLLPPQPGTAPNLLLCAGKNGTVYLLNRDNLGKFNSTTDQVVQEVAQFPGMTATPAYFNGTVYYKGSTTDISIPNPTPLYAYSLIPGTAATPTTVNFGTPTSQSSHTWGWPGSTPSISANGTSGAIVWVIEGDFSIPSGSPVSTAAILRAFDATNLATELYNSTQNAPDGLGNAVKFTLPTVAHGKVYVGANALTPGPGVVGEVSVFGLK